MAIVVPAWLAGATTWVVTARSLARHLRGPLFARGALGLAALLLLVAWAPIPAIRQLILALAPIGLLALGPGAPGSQTARKHTGVRRGQREKDSLLAERPPA
ncbi:MAG TPA: hypothetical protein VFL61_13800 [Gaiellaceae bacterium]|nr:hypothetical protein [Gaiellaceae bacterium]